MFSHRYMCNLMTHIVGRKMKDNTHFTFLSLILWLLLCQETVHANPPKKPHIIIIMSDDMGFNDMGVHGSDQIPTPNIDALCTFGITLNRYYVAPMCTPSRSSLMTGKYPSNVGMQHFVIASEQPWGLGLDQKLLPEYMREGGYRTHIVGKWHLGFYKKNYTPLERGFDSHFGYLGPYIDYYNYSLSRVNAPWEFESGYDMRSNFSMNYDHNGTYATDLFSDVAADQIRNHPADVPLFMYLAHLAPHAANEADPLQVPDDELSRFEYIADEKRRKYAAMVSRMDKGMGKVVAALQDKDMLANSVILFFCDNGSPAVGQHANEGSNYPFRGQKDTPWEGAVRSGGAIWSPLLKKRQRVSHQLFHVSDWLPTFAHLAGVKVNQPIDGQSIWNALSWDQPSPRQEALLNLDDVIGYSSYIRHEWKYVNGTTSGGIYDDWLSKPLNTSERHESFSNYGRSIMESETGKLLLPFSFSTTEGHGKPFEPSQLEQIRQEAVISCKDETLISNPQFKCDPLKAACLFNIIDDPCERKNLAESRPSILKQLAWYVEGFRKTALKPRNKLGETRANPKNFNGTWTWWYDELALPDHSSASAVKLTGSTVFIFGGVIIFGVIRSFRI